MYVYSLFLFHKFRFISLGGQKLESSIPHILVIILDKLITKYGASMAVSGLKIINFMFMYFKKKKKKRKTV